MKGQGYFGYNQRKDKSKGTQIVGAWDDAIDLSKEAIDKEKGKYE